MSEDEDREHNPPVVEYETYEGWVKTWPRRYVPIYGPGGGEIVPVPPCTAAPLGWDWRERPGGPSLRPTPRSISKEGWEAGRKPLLKKAAQALQKIYNGDVIAAVRILRGVVVE